MLRQLVVETDSRNQHQGISDLVPTELSSPNLVTPVQPLVPSAGAEVAMRLEEPLSIWEIQDRPQLGIVGFIRGIH